MFKHLNALFIGLALFACTSGAVAQTIKPIETPVPVPVVVAKRKGEQWFIGGITGNQPQNIEIDLGFLPAGQSFTLTSFEDGINADRQAMDYKKKESTVNNQTRMTLKMVRNGGWAGTIKMK